MPAVSLYRKWRPQTFADFIGQEHITTTLQNAIRANRIAHAYLFTGPRGTGKTTAARIFAKAISCTFEDEDARPCNRCEVCVSVNEGRNLDLIEIDAASNNSVDNIRELRERVGFSPNLSRYKVYIVDEVHMLSMSAFNALLKTLEEPPAHAIFVLATTEVDKLPATVLSRCQRFDFRYYPFRQIRDHLAMIAKAEGAQIEEGALDLFARQAGGSMRDGVSLLDQMIAYGDGTVTLKQAQTILGSVAARAVGLLTNHIVARDVSAGLNLINQAIAEGADPRQFLRETLEYLRGLLLLRGSPDGGLVNMPAETIAEMKQQSAALPTHELLAVIRAFSQAANQLRNAPQPQLPIEMAFVESALRGQGIGDWEQGTGSAPQSAPTTAAANVGQAAPTPAIRLQREGRTSRPHPNPPPQAGEGVTTSTPAVQLHPERGAGSPPLQTGEGTQGQMVEAKSGVGDERLGAIQERWAEVLAAVKQQNRSLEAVLKDGRIVALDKETVVVGLPYEFHKTKLEETKNKQLLEDVLAQLLGQPLRVRAQIAKAERKPVNLRPKDKKQRAMEDPLIKEVVTRYDGHIADVEEGPVDEA
ncbi:MAG: DNA polymerase III subunit gamma/tau [Chloroflexi bacterium]|nr:MAG: DNA polymerase III subunit gamma/tau [Chloroflexota bacterium]